MSIKSYILFVERKNGSSFTTLKNEELKAKKHSILAQVNRLSFSVEKLEQSQR